ncbi:MAG: NAD(P)H-binding protein, partial [Planctomycetota bacterium]
MRCLLTGATGYVGGRLYPALRHAGWNVRCLARDPDRLRDRLDPDAEVVRGDVLDAAGLAPAMEGVDVAFYLVHSMGRKGAFEDADRTGARNFALAAKAAGVRRVVYLGGLGRPEEGLSPHLASRQEVGRVLREHGPPLIELQASVVIGSGSLSFELVRSLVERLPVMVTPRWVRSLAQPIAIEDVVAYCLAAAALDDGAHHVVQIGGPDRVSYRGLM